MNCMSESDTNWERGGSATPLAILGLFFGRCNFDPPAPTKSDPTRPEDKAMIS
jgi:hypothetical protein